MITSLSLTNYKNYKEAQIHFSPNLNFLVGRNGMGKTNLLDAIHYLCMAKSHSTPLDKDTVQFEQPFFRIDAQAFVKRQVHTVCVKVQPGEIKEIIIDGKPVARLSEYLGFMPGIMLAPEDVELIQGGNSARRRFLDVVLCQANRTYLEDLQKYNKLLAQRNAALRMDGFRADRLLLMTYSDAMNESAQHIFLERKHLVEKLKPYISDSYHQLCDGREVPSLEYVSQLEHASFKSLVESSFESDLQTGHTTRGIHRDDLKIQLDDFAVKKFGSQGQIKSLLIAMHLAQAEYLKESTEETPVLLLDDIFDRLDEARSAQLVQRLSAYDGQVFITDASPARVERLAQNLACDVNIVEIEHGMVRKTSKL